MCSSNSASIAHADGNFTVTCSNSVKVNLLSLHRAICNLSQTNIDKYFDSNLSKPTPCRGLRNGARRSKRTSKVMLWKTDNKEEVNLFDISV